MENRDAAQFAGSPNLSMLRDALSLSEDAGLDCAAGGAPGNGDARVLGDV